ncbi:MAG TPA: cytochrome P450 [Acidimicrobiia bacterium]|nr:cytochrome P450 [Acidimicrobiia bacterium]
MIPLGDEYDPLADDGPALLYGWFARSRREEPVFYSKALDCWIVTRHDDVHEVLTNSSAYSATVSTAPIQPISPEALAVLVSGGWKHKSIFSTDGTEHHRFRTLIQRVFTPKRVADFEPFVAQQVEAACDRMEQADPVDVIAELCYPIPGLTILELLGFPLDYLEEMKVGATARKKFIAGRLDAEEQVAVAHGLVDSWRFASKLVTERVSDPRDDLMSDLLAVRNGDDTVLTLDELTSMLLTFFSAGHETSTYMMANALLHLLSDRDMWTALCADPGLADNAAEEALRFDAPLFEWRRLTTVETTLGGVTIPAGQNVFAILGSANRDPDLFPDPDRFDIHRAGARNHFAFGKGIHYCVGAPLARLEARITLQGLCRRFPDLRLAEDRGLDYVPNTLAHGPEALWVTTGRRS